MWRILLLMEFNIFMIFLAPCYLAFKMDTFAERTQGFILVVLVLYAADVIYPKWDIRRMERRDKLTKGKKDTEGSTNNED